MPVSRWDRSVDVATIAAALGALALVVAVMWRGPGNVPETLTEPDRIVPEWRTYAKQGNRKGPKDAAVVIVEFGDYECPACRAFEPHVNAVRSAFPEDVAVVYRHWPLSYHNLAYPAARAAECAALQGKFALFHDWLYRDSEWMADPRRRFVASATRIGIDNLEMFESCLDDSDPVDSIERDIAAAKELGGTGTPTVLVNDLLLGSLADSLTLLKLVDDALREQTSSERKR